MSKSRPVLNYRAPRAEGDLSRRLPLWIPVAIAISLAVGTIGYYSLSAPQLPISLLYRLLTDGIILLIWLSAAALGGWAVLKLFHVEQASLGLRIVTAAALGLGLISLATLGLGLAGWLNRWTAIGLLVALAASGVGFAVRTILPTPSPGTPGEGRGEGPTPSPSPCHVVSLSPCLLLVPLLLTALIGGLVYPGFLWGADDPAGYDVVSYHLQVPREWYELGQIIPLKHNVFSFFPFNVEMQYLLAMHLRGGPWEGMYLAQWMHLAYIVLAVAAIGTAVPPGRPRALAILAAGSCAWLTMLGAVAYNEGGLLLYGTLAIAWILSNVARASSPCSGAEEDHGQDARATFALAGVMAGLACGCKLTGVPMLVIGLPVAMLFTHTSPSSGTPGEGWGGGRPRARFALQIGIFVLASLACFSPWLIRNQVWAGNPVFPEAMRLLGRAHFTEAQVERWEAAHKPRPDQAGIGPHLKAGWEQVIADWRYGYVLLPLSLVAAGLTIRQRETRFLLALLVILILFWLFFTHLQGRFFVLGIPIMAMLIARAPWRALNITVLTLLLLATAVGSWSSAQRLRPMLTLTDADPDTPMLWTQVSSSGGYPRDLREAPMVTLVGEARAFWYPMSHGKLRYRTVFDVPGGKGGVPLEDAWVEGWDKVPDGEVVKYYGELLRFIKTYRNLPDCALVRPAD